MWTILIVEDEPLFRRSLIRLMNWEQAGFQIIGEAGDGSEALEFIEQHQPDLVIADIVMPEMSGLELLKCVKEKGIRSKFLMLTCMNEFEDARQALEYGASGYILKLSMSLESLSSALEKIKKELSEESGVLSHKDRLAFHKECVRIWEEMMRHPSITPGWMTHQAYPSRFEYMLIISTWQKYEQFSTETLLSIVSLQTTGQVIMHDYSVYGHTSYFIWSSCPFESFHLGKLPGTWDVSYGVTSNPDDVPLLWSYVLTGLNEHWYGKKNGIQHCSIKSDQIDAKETLSWKQEREIIFAFEQMKPTLCSELLEQLWCELEDRKTLWAIVKSIAERLDRIFHRISGQRMKDEEELLATSSHKGLLDVLRQRMNVNMNHWIRQKELLTDHEEINQMISYVKENYDQPISLKAMAKLVSMDEHYLSGLFKKKTGESFINYLQQTRIEKAKILLLETERSIVEIGRDVGIPNYNYFTKIFKRWVGCTPSQFRSSGC